MLQIKLRLLCLACLCAVGHVGAEVEETQTSDGLDLYEYTVPLQFPVRLQPVGKIDFSPINESSGIAASRKFPGVYWTHNDSGDWARIFAIDEKGNIITPPAKEDAPFMGFGISDARNRDWESICTDDKGNLIIADTGNNSNRRDDLGFYIVPEFDPRTESGGKASKHVRIFFPDQKRSPQSRKNYDCESVFYAHGKIHVFTKHRGDANSTLYRLDTLEGDEPIALTPVARFVARNMVTDADCTPDGKRLAVLALDSLWVFDAPEDGGLWFEGSARWLPIIAGQCEAVTWVDDNTLLLTNEQRSVFKASVDTLHEAPLRSKTK